MPTKPPPSVTTATMHRVQQTVAGNEIAGLVALYAVSEAPLPSVMRLPSGRADMGREAGVPLRVDAQAVSRRHAQVFRDSGRWWVVDLQSRNGTMVNGRFVSECQLTHHDQLRIGDAIFKFVVNGAEHYAGYRYDGTMESGHVRTAQFATSLVGGAQMDAIVASMERIAPTMLSVIVRGESGTGKEVAASEVHKLSGRSGKFVAVNCAAIPAALLESELFGYRKGAFSGADRDKIGLVKAAHGGTLFLDEIGDMPLEAQAKLLRVLQSKEVMPVGARAAEPVDVRIVCATHRDLGALQAEGKFRGDLFSRLQEYCVTLPPLRDRKEDIFLLTKALLLRHGRPDVVPSFAFMVALLHYDWPFNVRELEACLKRALALSDSNTLEPAHLPDALRAAMASYGQRNVWNPDQAERVSSLPASSKAAPRTSSVGRMARAGVAPTEAELRALLTEHKGNVAAVGRSLGKERMQIHRWMKRYGIEVADYRQ